MMIFVFVRILSSGGRVRVNIPSEACRGGTNEISDLEHVQVRWRFYIRSNIVNMQ